MKKIILICLMLMTLVSAAFAQVSFSESAKSRSTAGVFGSDADDLSAGDIFNIERMFFSAGYVPALSGGGSYGGSSYLNNSNYDENGQNDIEGWSTGQSVGTISAFWAMPINDTITVGLSGEYQMLALKDEEITLGVSNSDPNVFEATTTSGEFSGFNLRPVIKFGDFAFHYRIYRGTGASISTDTTKTVMSDGTQIYDGTKVDNDGVVWEHELGIAMKQDGFKVYLPIGVQIHSSRTSEVTVDESESYDSANFFNPDFNYETKYDEGDTANLYINPQVTIDSDMGPMSSYTIGLDMSFQLYNKSIDTATNYVGGVDGGIIGTDSEMLGYVNRVIYQGQVDANFDLYFNPSLEWSLGDGKVDFAVDPRVGIKYNHYNAGHYVSISGVLDQNSTEDDNSTLLGDDYILNLDDTNIEDGYVNTITPYIDVAIGTLARLTDWFELRAGVQYGLEWQNVITTKSYLSEGIGMAGNFSTAGYTFASTFNVYGGMGFIIGESFFIDAYLQIGQDTDGLALDSSDEDLDDSSNSLTSEISSFFSNLAYGVQLSYRF